MQEPLTPSMSVLLLHKNTGFSSSHWIQRMKFDWNGPWNWINYWTSDLKITNTSEESKLKRHWRTSTRQEEKLRTLEKTLILRFLLNTQYLIYMNFWILSTKFSWQYKRMPMMISTRDCSFTIKHTECPVKNFFVFSPLKRS